MRQDGSARSDSVPRPIGAGTYGSHLGDGYGAGPDINLVTADTGCGEGRGLSSFGSSGKGPWQVEVVSYIEGTK